MRLIAPYCYSSHKNVFSYPAQTSSLPLFNKHRYAFRNIIDLFLPSNFQLWYFSSSSVHFYMQMQLDYLFNMHHDKKNYMERWTPSRTKNESKNDLIHLLEAACFSFSSFSQVCFLLNGLFIYYAKLVGVGTWHTHKLEQAIRACRHDALNIKVREKAQQTNSPRRR